MLRLGIDYFTYFCQKVSKNQNLFIIVASIAPPPFNTSVTFPYRLSLHVHSTSLQSHESHQSDSAGSGSVPARPVQGGGSSSCRQLDLPPCQKTGCRDHKAQGKGNITVATTFPNLCSCVENCEGILQVMTKVYLQWSPKVALHLCCFSSRSVWKCSTKLL